MRIFVLLSLVFSSCTSKEIISQRDCGSSELYELSIKDNSEFLNLGLELFKDSHKYQNRNQKLDDEIYNIPVVVHVIQKTNTAIITDKIIKDQIKRLNEDFSGSNVDTNRIPTHFKNVWSGDTGIKFYIAETVNSENKSLAITRKVNNKVFKINSSSELPSNHGIKFKEYGGINAWSRDKYLNIWVGDIEYANKDGELAGYGTSPGREYSLDGVVIDYRYFGVGNHNHKGYKKGRTLTHEVGHWLNLNHIWGDVSEEPNVRGDNISEEYGCNSDDGLNDTPNQEKPYKKCPDLNSNPRSCDTLDMYMNFMDIVEDYCMVMFTKEQSQQMRLTLEWDRSSLFNTQKNKELLEKYANLITPVVNKFHGFYTENQNKERKFFSILDLEFPSDVEHYTVEVKKLGSNDWVRLDINNDTIRMPNLKEETNYILKAIGFKEGQQDSVKSHPLIFNLQLNKFRNVSENIGKLD